MRATRLHGMRDVRLDEIPDPGEPGQFEVVAKPLWCGLCGSDLKGYLGNGIGEGGPLRVMGHEFSAVITAVGPGVRERRVGEHVCVMPLEHCGYCTDCLRGEFNLCINRSFLGLYGAGALGGGLADLVLLKDYQAIPLEELSDEQGALVEPAAVAINAIIEAGVGPGHIVLVVGAGSIGSLVILAAQAAGAAVVLASEPNQGRADYARQFGAEVLDPGPIEDQVAQVRKLTGPRYPVDVAFDCAGRDGAMELCIGAIKPGGRICMVGGRRNGPPIDVAQLQQLPTSIVGSLAYTRHAWDRTIALIRAGKYPVERAISSRIDRGEISTDGFEALADPACRELKILVSLHAD
jgi:(R,R)-butanediol dehydrogenase/meso-butanediol dehydrogenase/diacetyl reductase